MTAIYLVTTKDKYELPLIATPSLKEACAFMNVKPNCLYRNSNGKHIIKKQYKIFRVTFY